MPDEPQLRASDQEREHAASEIREHYAAGRLTSAEFEERVQAAYGARTQSELDALSADLPALPPKPPTTMERARDTFKFNTGVLVRNASGGLSAFVICTAIWLAAGAHGSFWPVWVLLFTLVAVVRGVRRGARGPGPRGGGGGPRGRHYSYRYEYHYGDDADGHEHRHEHRD